MTDTIWHILLGLVLANLFAAVVLLAGPHAGAAMLAAFWLFTREVTQKQADYENDFRKGWDFWNWSRSKNIETWVPVACVLAFGFGSVFWGVQ